MRKFALAAVVAVVGVVASPAYAFHCPADMAKIDAALAKTPQLSADQLTKVKTLRTEGEALHKAGNHTQSVTVLGEAMAILGIK